MSSSFEALPTEILINILCQVGTTKVLYNFALCSHQFYDLAIPFIYPHVILNIDPYRYHESNQLENFAIFILEKPHVANHVRALTFCDKWPNIVYLDPPSNSYPTEEGVRSAREDLKYSLQRAVKSSSFNTQGEHGWLIDLTQMKHADPLIALLLPALTKLERLELPLAHAGTYYQRMVERASRREEPVDTRPMFQSNKDFIYDWKADILGISSAVLSPLLELPSIRSIYGFKIGRIYDEPVASLCRLQSGSSSLTYLELKECKICPQNITNMLRTCKSLKTFILDWAASFTGYNFTSAETVCKALVSSRKSLENLRINHQQDEIDWGHDEDYPATIGSLAAFDMLKHVKVEMAILFGGGAGTVDHGLSGMVPSTIQSLHITNCFFRRQYLATQLKDLLFSKELVAPSLKEITIETYHFGNGEEYDFGSLDFLAGKAGVNVNELNENHDAERSTRGWKAAGCIV